MKAITDMNGNTSYVSAGGTEHEEQPQPSDVDEPLTVGIEAGTEYGSGSFLEELIRSTIHQYFSKHVTLSIDGPTDYSDVFHGTARIGDTGVRIRVQPAPYTGVIEEESGLEQNNSLPESPSWEEVGEWWNNEWGTWEINHPDTLVINDDGMPLWAKQELEGNHSGVLIEYDNGSDTSCTNGGAMDDEPHTKSKQSFSGRMNDLADELDEQAREREEERVKQYLRDNRETFKAEITDVRARTESVVIDLDVPTHGSWSYTTKLPDGDGRGERLYEILSYLGADLRHMDMIEGMYLPVAYVDGDWVLQLPSDAPPFTESFWLKPRSFSLPSIPRPSVSKTLTLLILLGFFGSIGVFVVGFVLVNPMWVLGGAVGALVSFFHYDLFSPN